MGRENRRAGADGAGPTIAGPMTPQQIGEPGMIREPRCARTAAGECD